MKYLLSVIVTFLLTACASIFDTPFLGADSIGSGAFLTSRWYLKPEYKNSKSLGGSPKDYGASFKKIDYKYDKKYYEKTKNGRDDIVIPKKNIWTVKHTGKRFNVQDDENFFIYKKQGDRYIRHNWENGRKLAVEDNDIYPVKECYSDGWCKLYPNYWKIDLYIKQSILDKPLSEE